MNNRLGYIVLDKADPFLTVYLKGIKLSDVTTTGSTNMAVTRVGENALSATYTPLSVDTNANSFLFQIDNNVLNTNGGRYTGAITYKGTLLGNIVFSYSKAIPNLVGA